VLFLRYFYTNFILVIIIFLRFLFDLFCRFGTNEEKSKKMREKMVKNVGNGKLGQIDLKPAQKF